MRNSMIILILMCSFFMFAEVITTGNEFAGESRIEIAANQDLYQPLFTSHEAENDDYHVAVKLNRIKFTDREIKHLDVNRGMYVGLEGYMKLDANVYVGAEVGYAHPQGSRTIYSPDNPYHLNHLKPVFRERLHASNLDAKLKFIPIELNAKYVVDQIHHDLLIDLGVGISLNYVDSKIEGMIFDGTGPEGEEIRVRNKDWLIGGQLFTNVNYKLGDSSFIGLNAKYQKTEKMLGNNFDNWRLGVQLGFMF